MNNNTDNNRLTWQQNNGEWGLRNHDIKKVPRELYGVICKLKDYENTGLNPEDIYKLDEQFLKKCEEVNQLRRAIKDIIEIIETQDILRNMRKKETNSQRTF